MRHRLSVLAAVFLSFFILAVVWHFSVIASRTAKDLPSSQNGFDLTPAGTCTDNFPTPFAAALDGTVDAVPGGACINFAANTYPNYTLQLQPQDKSFTLTVTPVLWENQGGGGSRETILHLEFSSTNTKLKLQSFVMASAGTVVNNPTNPNIPFNPNYLVCDFDPNGTFFTLKAVKDNLPGDTPTNLTACTQPTMSPIGATPGQSGNARAIQPTPIQFADGNTTRWDISGISGSNPLPATLPSVDIVVPGFPNDSALNVDAPLGTPPTNGLTKTFMANQSNFLVVALDTSTTPPTTVVAGTLSIPATTRIQTNDSVLSPTVIDPLIAITTGFSDQINTATATPLENADGTPQTPLPNPPDPTSCSTPFRTVWYSFTPLGTGTVTIDTAKSRYDTVLAMFKGSPGNLVLVGGACNDDTKIAK